MTAVVYINRNTWPGGDSDSFSIGAQIADFLRAAHWNLLATNIPDEWVWPVLDGSVQVQVNDRPVMDSLLNRGPKEDAALAAQAAQAGKALVKELNDGGLDAEYVLSRMKLPVGIVIVVVGERQNPFENKLLEQRLDQRATLLESTDPESAKRLRRIVESLQASDNIRRLAPKLRAMSEMREQRDDDERRVLSRIFELQSKRFVPGSKELSDAQTEFNTLNERLGRLNKEQDSLWEQERILLWGTNAMSPTKLPR
jgi:hypothetical protein